MYYLMTEFIAFLNVTVFFCGELCNVEIVSCVVAAALDEQRMRETLESVKAGREVTVSDYDFVSHSS